MKFYPTINIEYETCNCTNNSYTHHLVEPYKKEIETWLFQTNENITTPTRQFLCPECDEKTDAGFFASITDTLSHWYENVRDTVNLWFNSEDSNNINHEPKEIIHPLCFQMGHKLIEATGSNKQFFSCIRNHYDGSEEDHLCRPTVDKPSAPQQCIALPISCQDANDINLKCPNEIRSRPDQFKLDGCNKGASYPRRPCLNQLYTAITMKAFYDVSQCLEVDDFLVFPLFFHESRFILNIKSHKGALCHSQLTGNAVSDVNALLEGERYSQLQPFFEPHHCPEVWKHFQKIKTRKSITRYMLQSAQDQCHLNLNPYTCFFYGMGYLKILTLYAENAVSKTNTIGRIPQNEGWIVLWNLKKSTQEIHSNKVEEMKIFRDIRSLINILVIISYNGGPSISSQFTQYMHSLKEHLQSNSSLRKTLFEKGLSLEYFKDTFIEFLRQNYKPVNRREEVAQFLNKVIRDIDQLNQFIRTQYRELEENICPSPL